MSRFTERVSTPRSVTLWLLAQPYCPFSTVQQSDEWSFIAVISHVKRSCEQIILIVGDKAAVGASFSAAAPSVMGVCVCVAARGSACARVCVCLCVASYVCECPCTCGCGMSDCVTGACLP